MDNDKDLIRQCLKGDSAAFGVLYDRYFSKIHAFIFYKTNHKETTEDLVSLTFMKAWDNLENYRGESFQAWLYSIAKNNVNDHYRKTKPIGNIDDYWDLSDDTEMNAETELAISRRLLKKAMNQLSAVEREVLIMRYWQDLSFKEISEITGKNESAVKMKMYRSLEKLKQHYPVTPILFTLIKLLYEQR